MVKACKRECLRWLSCPTCVFSKEHVTERKNIEDLGDHRYFAVATIEIRWKAIVQTSTKGDIFVASPETAVQLDCLCEELNQHSYVRWTSKSWYDWFIVFRKISVGYLGKFLISEYIVVQWLSPLFWGYHCLDNLDLPQAWKTFKDFPWKRQANSRGDWPTQCRWCC